MSELIGPTPSIASPGIAPLKAIAPNLAQRFVRWSFEAQAMRAARRMDAHTPQRILSLSNVPYREGDPDATLDIYYRSQDEPAHPAVLWVHGGAWLSGSKRDVAPYLKILASHGMTAIGVDYTLSPKNTYPYQLGQLADALDYVIANAAQLRVDPHRIVLAGDSAGAHIVAQLAALLADSTYADRIGVKPVTSLDAVAGVVLACGSFDIDSLWRKHPSLRPLLRLTANAYVGVQKFRNNPLVDELSLNRHVNAKFPSTFITVGNADPFARQSLEFAKHLDTLGVDVTRAFFSRSHRTKLGHEYQFNLDTDEGKSTLGRLVDFVHRVTAPLALQ